MATEQTKKAAILTTDMIRKLVIEKVPAGNEAEKVRASILVALSERLDRVEAQLDELLGAVKVLAAVVGQMRESDEEEEPAGETPKQEATAEDSAPRDKTPFPAGVPTTGPIGGAASGPTPDAAPKAPPKPNASSGPAVNAQPIPKRPPPAATAKNGREAGKEE